MRRVLISLVFVLSASPSLASNGVLEINQTCAVQTGCFSGDAAGWPVSISSPGSYRLTGNLTLPDADTTGIEISTSDVGVDLNNFAIIRSGCEGVTLPCTPTSGSGSGVDVTSSLSRGHAVKNGSITGMGSNGVSLGIQAEVTNLRARWNRLDGIDVGFGSVVSGSTANDNGNDGISGGAGSAVSGNASSLNGGNGISVGGASNVFGNTSFGNTGNGIESGLGSNVSGNSIWDNRGVGIHGGDGSTISNNTSRGNGDDGIFAGEGVTVTGNTSIQNADDGIVVDAGSLVERNTIRENGSTPLDGAGLVLTGNAGYRDNMVTANTNVQVSGGTNLGGNFCSGPGTSMASCP